MANNQTQDKINNAVKRSVKKNVRRQTQKAAKRSPVGFVIFLLVILALYLGMCGLDHNNVDLGIHVDSEAFGKELKIDNFDIQYGDFELDFTTINVLGKILPENIASVPVPADGEAIFHFIDVGQGDAILITTKGGNILIDTSEPGAHDQLDAYLRSANVTELKYLVLTHPDADHIGNAEEIIRSYKVDTVVMSEYVGTTKTYERVLDAIEDEKCNVIIGETGESFVLEGLQCIFLGPVGDYGDPNEMSLVIKAIYGDTSVMFTGDAEEKSEEDILKRWSKDTLKCDILKVGHHGSSSSTTKAFLDAVDPEIAVISCGDGNKYGHPHAETLNRLEGKVFRVWRTDKDGTIVYKTDGKSLTLVDSGK